MLVITDVVFLVRFSVFSVFIAFCACKIQDDRDYCKKDQDRCDNDGVYKYIGVTNYEDYEIRDRLDDDFELIGIRPKLALKKNEKTLQKYPNSPRAILNKALALRSCYAAGDGSLAYPEYLSISMELFTQLTTIPMERMMAGLLNHVCEMWIGLAASTEDNETVVKVTTACLKKKTSLGNDLIFSLSASQSVNLFLQKEYEASLIALTSFYETVDDVQQMTGKEVTPEPFLAMLQLAANKILHNPVESGTIETLKQNFKELRKKDTEVLQVQKDKYDGLVDHCKEKLFDDEAMMIMYGVGIDAGIYLSVSKYQKPTEIVPGLKSKTIWRLTDFDPDTVKK